MSFTGNNPSFKTTTLRPMPTRPANPVEGMIYYDDGTTNTEGVYKYQNSNWEFISSLVDFLRLNPQSADPTTPSLGDVQYSDGTVRTIGLWQFNGTVWERVGNNVEDFNYIPQDADPTSPVEGQVFFSDGTSRTIGLWTYKNSNWERIGNDVDSFNLIPQSADPISPSEGELQYSDGTVRAEGVYVFQNSSWIQLAQSTSQPVAILRQEVPAGTSGASYPVANVWQDRDINTVIHSGTIFATVNSVNRTFELLPGNYCVEGLAQAFLLSGNKLRIIEEVSGNTVIVGTANFSGNSQMIDEADILGFINITSTTSFKIQHIGETANTGTAFGDNQNFGENNIHLQMKITKLS